MTILSITDINHIPGVLDKLRDLGAVTLHPNPSKQDILSLLLTKMFDVIFTNPNKQKFVLDEEMLKDSGVNHIITASTGTNHIDLDYCKKNNISVTSITDDLAILEEITSTAELAFGLMMSIVRHIPSADRSVKAQDWDWQPFLGRQLNKMTIGLVGYGRLGKMMFDYCTAFGMKVLVYDPHIDMNAPHVQMKTLEELFERSEIVSLHVHVTDETKGFINEKLWLSRKKELYLVNTSRGAIVDEHEIIKGLKEKTITGYATDVLDTEFTTTPTQNNWIVGHMRRPGYNIVITPHLGGSTIDAQEIAYNAVLTKFIERHGSKIRKG